MRLIILRSFNKSQKKSFCIKEFCRFYRPKLIKVYTADCASKYLARSTSCTLPSTINKTLP